MNNSARLIVWRATPRAPQTRFSGGAHGVTGPTRSGFGQELCAGAIRQLFRLGLTFATAVAFIGSHLCQALAAETPTPSATSTQRLRVHLSWGHQSSSGTEFAIQLLTADMAVTDITSVGLEAEDSLSGTTVKTRAGAGDIDGVAFTLQFPERTVHARTNLQQIWGYLLEHSDPETRRRLRHDPGYRPDTRKLTLQMNSEGTRGFSMTVDQLLTNKTFWVPVLDVLVATGDSPVSFAEHQTSLAPWRGQRVLDQIEREPEANYGLYTTRWEDMGSPCYRNPASVGPGHIVCLTWDSAIRKFGVDRGAGVWNDYGNPDRFYLGFDFGDLRKDLSTSWKGQRLTDGLPVISTTFEQAGVRYEVEQFAYPLNGPPAERRGDIPMVLLQKLKLTELTGTRREVSFGMTHRRELADTNSSINLRADPATKLWYETAQGRLLLAIDGNGLSLQSNLVEGTKWKTNRITFGVDLPANGSRELTIKLPSPPVPPAERGKLLAINYAAARADTIRFWSDYLARGAQFEVPDEPVNMLFRASLWHALRLPRRHGGSGPEVRIDLPYSNFAYDQNGTPWPVNQAIYVDYMLYDLRGYHAISAEELAVMFRNNQEANGHIKGYANWGVYTPSMIYTVAKHFLLSGDRASFERLLPQTLKAWDWGLNEMKRASERSGPTSGLILAPLNDLSHDNKAWAFNQSYLFAGAELLGRALAEVQHPRAQECRAAAQNMFEAVQRGFAHASMESPLVQLRDHTWIPYVPCDALTPRRLLEIWYPTDVDTGALHLSRLKALDPNGPLTTSLLHDHEDNLFYRGWGMANEPVYNQHATAYLLRDEVKPVIRAFYSMLACAFSHSVFESVEHRWGWGQYFCPPSTDGAWFDLYRHMLIHERDDDTLLLLQATPRRWLEDGKRIRVERAPTYYGPLRMSVQSRTAASEISAVIDLSNRKHPKALLIRFRHPRGQQIKSVAVNGRNWNDFDVQKEWVQIANPTEASYQLTVRY